MRAVLLFTMVGLLLLPGSAMAQGFFGTTGACCGLFGLDFDYGWRGDDHGGIGVSTRFLFPAGREYIQVGGFWGDGESRQSEYVIPENGATHSRQPMFMQKVDTDVWAGTANWIHPIGDEDKSYHYFVGAGPGWYKVSGPGWEADDIGLQLLAGATCDKWFGEVRWVLGTEFDWGGGELSDVNGVRFSLGRWIR